MPVECIDWRRFAYGQTSADSSSSLPDSAHALKPETTKEEQNKTEAENTPQTAASPNAPSEAKDQKGPAGPAEHMAQCTDIPEPASPTEAPSSGLQPHASAVVAASVGDDGAAEPVTPPVRLASLHDSGGGRSSGWLSFGSSSISSSSGKLSGSSRSRGSHGSSTSSSSKSTSKTSSSSSGGKQHRSVASVSAAPASGESTQKRRKLLRGGVAACGYTSSESDSAAAATGGGARTSSGGGRSVGLSSKNNSNKGSSSSSSSGSEATDSDEESLDALQLCLQESEAMTDLLVNELGGPTPEGRGLVRQQIAAGRCHCSASFSIPPSLQQHSGAGWERLKDYQKCGVHWLVSMHKANRNGILADEMGLGKTAQTCVFFNYAYSSGLLSAPTLVAAPASLVDNWVREFEMWAPHLCGRVVKYAGKQSERRSLALQCIESLQTQEPFRVLVASVNSLSNKWDIQYLRQLRPFAYLVVDEAHALKNKDSQVYKNINKMAKCERRILLTGSPIQNRTGELRNLLLFLMPAVFDAESLDLALTAFEKQAQRQKACKQKTQLKAEKLQQQQQQRQQQQQEQQGQQQEQQQQQEEPRRASADASEPDTAASSSNGSSSSSSSSTCEEQQGAATAASDSRGFLSRAFASLAIRGSEGAGAEEGLPADVICLQRVLSPFILRRLKSEVMQELPKKTNRVVRCELEDSQKALYLEEVRRHQSDLALSLRRLTQAFAPNEETAENGSSNSSSSSSSSSGSGAAAKDSAAEEGPQVAAKDGKEAKESPESGGKRFVSSLLFRLRRICNHSLLMQSRYTAEQKDRMARHYAYHVDGFKGNPIEKIRAEFDKWSDYEIHQGIRMLAEQGDMKLADLALPAESFLESTKLRKAFELLKEVQSRGEKALVFSQFTTFLDVVEEALQLHLPTLRFCRLDGSTVVEERQRLVDGFNQTGDCTAFLLSTKAGGQGLNLTAARTVILLDQDWNPQNDRQAEDRVHRLGQTHDVTVYRLCCRGTVEESILKCCQRKLDLDSAFGGNSEVLQAAILRDSLESGGIDGDEPLLRLSPPRPKSSCKEGS